MSKIVRDRDNARSVWILIFVVVSVVCIIFFAARGRFELPISNQAALTALAPFQRAAAWANSKVQHVFDEVHDIMNVHEQNKQLKTEVEKLRAQNVRANEYAEENIRLRGLLAYKDKAVQFDLVPARVIGREAATWTNMIVIDRGSNDGVQKEMAVVTDRGLVGSVTEVSALSSKVELITDARVAVGALVQRSRLAGVVEGTLKDPAHPRMVNVPRNADINSGDTIITSGFGGIYPKGIVVGHVSEVRNDEGGLLKYGVIEPAVDFQKIEDVAVIVASREAPPQPVVMPVQAPGAGGK